MIKLRQFGSKVAVFFDDRFIIEGEARMAGTATVYPALGSEIHVREILVEGDLDPFNSIQAPLGQRR